MTYEANGKGGDFSPLLFNHCLAYTVFISQPIKPVESTKLCNDLCGRWGSLHEFAFLDASKYVTDYVVSLAAATVFFKSHIPCIAFFINRS